MKSSNIREGRYSIFVLKSEFNHFWLTFLRVRSHLACKLAAGAFRNFTFIHWHEYSEKILSWFYLTLTKSKFRLQRIRWNISKFLYFTYVFIIFYAWVFDNNFKDHCLFRGRRLFISSKKRISKSVTYLGCLMLTS